MDITSLNAGLDSLREMIEGDLYTETKDRLLYSTDASAYREVPIAVARPKHSDDIRQLVLFAGKYNVPLIPRAAGTSLAGQVVGSGIVVDVSRYMTRILEINVEESWVRVEPGVILDELNKALAPYGLFFGPETSTSNRCMIGGMLGNNACGAHSLIYGSTRDHTISVKCILSDGSAAEFGPLSDKEFNEKCTGSSLESSIYSHINRVLSDPAVHEEIRREYPDPSIKRRNTGYAIDLLAENRPFNKDGKPFNFSRLLAGSEGTLAFTTEIKLNLVPVPPGQKILVCCHFSTLEEALQGNLTALDHSPAAVELMDRFILDCTRDNIEQRKNRFFIKGDPGAILIIEFAGQDMGLLLEKASALESSMGKAGLGYHFPVISGPDMARVWALRKAGLGVLSNIPGDAKPVSVIEDTAVNPRQLPSYIAEFKQILEKYRLECVYHAHVATGELHLRPVLNLKDPGDVELFRTIAEEIAILVKKYRGSLSGEHGDGRLRGEFIPIMVGEKNYEVLKGVKKAWDPGNVFNPGKITETPPMNTHLRHVPGEAPKEVLTYFDFSGDGGMIRAVEKCNGSGDCRKTEITGGTMCPSYMATRDESTTTRARANILREFLTNSTKKNPFDHEEIREIMDLCLSCKGCKSECPSNVDITKYKAEFLQHYHDEHGIPLRSRAIAYISSLNRLGSLAPPVFNFFITNTILSKFFKRILGFAPARSIPPLSHMTLKAWAAKERGDRQHTKTVYLFADEFTDYNDTAIGIKAILLLNRLGYKVVIPDHQVSARTFLSKGLVRKARSIAQKNVSLLKGIVTEDSPLVGIEPSGILTFRDEYPDLVGPGMREDAIALSQNCLLIDEFISMETEKGNITSGSFVDDARLIRLHGHCHQKALSSTLPTRRMLSLPANYTIEEIPSGCCGMAGSFGFEKEHYDLSMKVGELILFPEVRKTPDGALIAATGTSCRHQIKDGTGRIALHPVEILHDALKPE